MLFTIQLDTNVMAIMASGVIVNPKIVHKYIAFTISVYTITDY